jgi:hypothetical protein
MPTDLYRMTLCLTEEQEKAIFELRKTDKFCRVSIAEIIRYLINQGIKADSENKKGK